MYLVSILHCCCELLKDVHNSGIAPTSLPLVAFHASHMQYFVATYAPVAFFMNFGGRNDAPFAAVSPGNARMLQQVWCTCCSAGSPCSPRRLVAPLGTCPCGPGKGRAMVSPVSTPGAVSYVHGLLHGDCIGK